ncbi:MAG: hypothetical protein HY842_19970 [Bacteroidetes bacterium]|nr:hypothetical protein [Bacteroidota bacterium]
MKNSRAEQFYKIKALTREIVEADTMQKKFSTNDEVETTMARQFQFKKNTLIKELLATLIQSDFGIGTFDEFIAHTMAYLKTSEKPVSISYDLKTSISRLESTLS